MYRVEKWTSDQAPNAAMLRYILTAEGYSVLQWGDSPGSAFPTHSHGNDQTHWIISGALEMTVERFGTVTLEPGDRDFMPAGTYHSARVIGGEHVIYLVGEK